MPIRGATKGRVAEIVPTEEDEIRIRRITVDDFFPATEDTENKRSGGDAASKSVERESSTTAQDDSVGAR